MTVRSTIVNNCDLCGNTEFEVRFSKNEFHSDIARCKSCGLVFSNPQVERNYSDYPNYIRNYIKSEKGRRLTSRWRIKQIQKYVSRGNLLEIGCSGGFFLDEAQKTGFQVTGTELNQEAVKYGRDVLNLLVYSEQDLSSIKFPEKFNVIAMFNLLEHIPKPYEFLKYITDHLLAEGGKCVIEIPNIFTFQFRFVGTKCHHLSWAHYYYFSQETFKLLAEKVGLVILECKSGKRLYPMGNAFGTYLHRNKFLKNTVAVC